MKNIKGFESWRRKMRKAPKIYAETIDKTLAKSGAEMARSVRALVPVGRSGRLRDSVGSRVEAALDGSSRSVVIFAGDDDAYYARFVEFGTQASTKGQRVSRASGDRKAGRTHTGTTGRPFFWPAYRIMRRLLKRRLKSASRRAARKVVGGA